MSYFNGTAMMKYGEGNGSIVEGKNFIDEQMRYSEFHYFNNKVTMDIECNFNEYLSYSDKQSNEVIHIYDKTQYPTLVQKVKTFYEKMEQEKSNSTQSTKTYSGSSYSSSSTTYHSKYDGSPQKQFQGSMEQEEQLRQMDEMGW